MKVLLSAYACEPDIGSEPGVGWHMAMEIAALGHQVVVLTRSNNRGRIEKKLAEIAPIPNLRFEYFDLPGWMKWWKKGRQGVHLYYLLWQRGAYGMARGLHEREAFDLVHHVTFVSLRQPSFMGKLGIPFIFGPISGGDSIPIRLRKGSSFRARFNERLRDLVNAWVRFSPMMRGVFKRSSLIYATSQATRELIPAAFQDKTRLKLAIGIAPDMTSPPDLQSAQGRTGLRLLYVGHLLFLKGIHLGLRAFAELLKVSPDSRFSIVGRGVFKPELQRLAAELGVEANVDWVDWVDQRKLKEIYQSHDLFLFPSLRDSGGMALLEAMGRGLPAVCLALGGPGQIVTEACGRGIDAAGKDEIAVGHDLGKALIEIAGDPALRKRLAQGAYDRACSITWAGNVADIYRDAEALVAPAPRVENQPAADARTTAFSSSTGR